MPVVAPYHRPRAGCRLAPARKGEQGTGSQIHRPIRTDRHSGSTRPITLELPLRRTVRVDGMEGKVTDIKKTTVNKTPTLATAADSKPYTALVFGNGGVRNGVRDDLSTVDTAADDYYQEVGVKLGSAGAYPETHGGGDVMLFSDGAGSAGFKGTLDNTKVFTLIKNALGL